ncbi:MAG TPA: ABC transporter ATP-binding protein [Cycloclasticus sp.]|nr:ABC transporter ATP-binding protein [Cycloclasticus sp.]
MAKLHKPTLIKANLIALVAVIASVPVPLLMPLLVDEVLLNQPSIAIQIMQGMFPTDWHGPLLYIGALLLLTLLLRGTSLIFNVIHTRLFTVTAKDITFQIRKDLLTRLQYISMADFETVGSGTVATHFITDLETVDNFIGSTTSKLLVAILTVIGTSAVLLWMHWQLALFILFLNPVVIYFTTVLGKRVKHLKANENKAFEVFQQSLTETLEAISEIRANNRSKHYTALLTEKAGDIKTHASNFSWRSDAANRLSFMVFLFGFDIFRAIAMFMVVYSGLSIGEMFAVFGYLWFMMGPVQEILTVQFSFFSAEAALTRINSLICLDNEPRYPHQINPFTDKHTVSIKMENIHFSYGSNLDVLNGLTLHIKAGEQIALVGASGGGKSTLIQALLGLYPISQGMIYFDDVAIDKIGFDVVRDNVSTVLQHPVLFNSTVRDNLCMGRVVAEDELWKALSIAQLESTIKDLPKQLDTLVGRQGVRLSGGQRQRLAIARMILSKPKVVILDEATSALDSETEFQLHKAIKHFLKGRTTIIIAHRLSAVKQADHVYVFEDGMISEQGSHDSLIEKQGLYAKLYGERQH